MKIVGNFIVCRLDVPFPIFECFFVVQSCCLALRNPILGTACVCITMAVVGTVHSINAFHTWTHQHFHLCTGIMYKAGFLTEVFFVI